MKKLIYLMLLLSIAACGEDSLDENKVKEDSAEGGKSTNGINVWISGQISGAVNQSIVLEVASEQGKLKLGGAIIDQNGHFEIEGNVLGMGMYQLHLGVGENKIIPVTLSPGDKVNLEADFSTFESLPVFKGTKWATNLTAYMSKFNEFVLKQIEMSKKTGLSEQDQINAFLKMRKPLDEFASDHILKDPSNPANLVLMTSLTPAMGYEYWDKAYLISLKKMANAYAISYKNTPIVASIQRQVDEIEAGLINFQENNSGTKTAAEISLPNPSGNIIKLSSLKGSVVLIDFWASWCRPCRAENPNVVRLYNKFKSKGFTVFSVSLDSDAAAWKRAIEADGLIWPNHGSDLKEWNTPLKEIYGFNAIPYTVLVDRQGKIVGINLRGEKLEQKLKEIL